VISLLTTSRKATVGAVIASLVAFLGPLAALYVSDQPITGRLVIGCLLAGAIAGLTTFGGTWAAPNTEEYVPVSNAQQIIDRVNAEAAAQVPAAPTQV
jgi:hypothetical protein